MKGVRAVLFDLDGVLVHSQEVWFAVLNAAAREYAAPAISRELFASCWGQGIRLDIEKFFPDRSVSEVAAFYARRFPDELHRIRVEEEAAEVLAALRRRSIATAVVTNSPLDVARAALAVGGLEPDEIVGGTCVARQKPAPDMIDEACRRLAVATAQAVVVGDSGYDRDAARAAGVRFIGFGMEGDARIDRLAELVDPTFTSSA